MRKQVHNTLTRISLIFAISVVYAFVVVSLEWIGYNVPSLISPDDVRVEIGIIGTSVAVIISLGLIEIVNESELVQRRMIKIPEYIWDYFVGEFNNGVEEWNQDEFEKQKEMYISEFLTKFPYLIFIIVSAASIVYMYTQTFNLVLLSGIFLISGLIVGSFETAILSDKGRFSPREKRAVEARKSVYKQMQIVLYIIAIVLQIGNTFGYTGGQLIITMAFSAALLLTLILPLPRGWRYGDNS